MGTHSIKTEFAARSAISAASSIRLKESARLAIRATPLSMELASSPQRIADAPSGTETHAFNARRDGSSTLREFARQSAILAPPGTAMETASLAMEDLFFLKVHVLPTQAPSMAQPTFSAHLGKEPAASSALAEPISTKTDSVCQSTRNAKLGTQLMEVASVAMLDIFSLLVEVAHNLHLLRHQTLAARFGAPIKMFACSALNASSSIPMANAQL